MKLPTKYTLRRTRPTGKGKRSRRRGWFLTRQAIARQVKDEEQRFEIVRYEGREQIVETRFELGEALKVARTRIVGKPSGTLIKFRTDRDTWAIRSVAVEPPVDPARAEMVEWCWWAIEHDDPIHYSQVRPFPLYEQGSLPMTLDCSGSTITFARWAGAPNPSGAAPGYGNSASIAAFAKQIPREQALAGDIVVFGDPITHHVAVILEAGDDPLMESHGGETGPFAIRLSVEERYHAPDPLRFFSLTERA